MDTEHEGVNKSHEGPSLEALLPAERHEIIDRLARLVDALNELVARAGAMAADLDAQNRHAARWRPGGRSECGCSTERRRGAA